MRNKPVILSSIISIVYFFTLAISSLTNNTFYQILLTLIVLFGFSLYMGKSYSKNFKETMPKANKLKISLYYFIFWFLFISSIVILMVMNTTLKDMPLFSMNQEKAVIILAIFLMNFLIFAVNGLCIYYAIGLGCKLELFKNSKL